MYYKVVLEGDGESEWHGHDELEDALADFLSLLRYDRQVSLIYIGEEYGEE